MLHKITGNRYTRRISGAIKKRKRPKGYNKYGAKKVKCMYGHKHDSKGEANHCLSLAADLQAGRIKGYCAQHKVPIVINDVLICEHIVDFAVMINEDYMELHEFKGRETRDWKIKANLVAACFPSIPYIIIKKGENGYERTRHNPGGFA